MVSMPSPSPLPDLVVVGGGTAGIVAAQSAASLGARVVMIERDAPGGDCLWTGCVPSKTLLAAAHTIAQARRAARYGLAVRDGPVDFAAVMAHVHAAIATIAPVDSVDALKAAGITVMTGTAVFTGPDSLDVDGTPVRFRRALVATGAAPTLPPVPGLAECGPLTSGTVWSLTDLPSQLVILGGGSIGCELGQAFARLGSQVTLIEGDGRLLPLEPPAAADLLLRALRADDVDVRLGQLVTQVDSGAVILADQTRIEFDQLLVAVGRTPRTDGLGLAGAGVQITERGVVEVNKSLQTTNPRIWAAGDLTGHPQFTHTAGMHANLAATNVVLGLRRSTDRLVIPRVTFTQPEVASVGVTAPTEQTDRGLRVVTIRHGDLDRAVTEDDTAGFSQLVLDRRGRVVGATIVGPRAGESVGEATLAIQNGLRARDIASTTHPYPTFNDGVWNAAIQDVQRQLRTPLVRAGIGRLLKLRRLRRG
jgi:pyruvate/2-oxoglutarate dehydrogenase complex dihydrolipoamide dehydrogenase (E3) component